MTVYTIENTKHQREESVGGGRKWKDHSLEKSSEGKSSGNKENCRLQFFKCKSKTVENWFYLIDLKWHHFEPSMFSQLKFFLPLCPLFPSLLPSFPHWISSISCSNLYSLIYNKNLITTSRRREMSLMLKKDAKCLIDHIVNQRT